jgi:hypothetical protein
MRIEGRVFSAIGAFCLVMAVIYWVWSANDGGTEVVGVVCLFLSAGLCGIVGTYLAFVARRLDPRPEDLPDADISDGAGDLGFFSPGSYWPVGIAGAGAIEGIAMAFWQPWLIVTGIVLILLTVSGLLFEYYIGQNTPLR